MPGFGDWPCAGRPIPHMPRPNTAMTINEQMNEMTGRIRSSRSSLTTPQLAFASRNPRETEPIGCLPFE